MLFTNYLKPENCLGRTAYEVFKEKKISNGNRWSKVLLSFAKERKRVWFSSLENAYDIVSYYFGGIQLPLKDFERKNGDYVMFDFNDIIPHDRTIGQVRYIVRTQNNNGLQEKAYRAKVGKMVREYLQSDMYKIFHRKHELTDTLIDYLCEEAASRLNAYFLESSNYTLIVNENFEEIYSTSNTLDNDTFGSCQMDKELWDFYENIEGAHAMSLWDEDDNMVCRAIYFDEIHVVGEDKTYKGIERMYSYGSDNKYKLLMLSLAIKQGLVDIFKSVSSGAYDTHSWRIVKGESDDPFEKNMFIKLKKAYTDEHIAWGDSFKYYYDKKLIIANFDNGDDYIRIENYDSGVTFEDTKEWHDGYSDEYYRYCEEEPYEVYMDGEVIFVTRDERREHFMYIESEDAYYYEEDVARDYLGQYIVKKDAVFSDKYDEYLLSEDAIWSEYYQDYIPDIEAVKVYTDYENLEYEMLCEDDERIVKCDEGYYIFVENSVEIDGHVLDKNVQVPA